jgi:GNAT superfamily N-acetyltransferase
MHTTPAVTTRPASPLDTTFLLRLFTVSDDSRAWLAQIDPRLIEMQFSAQQRAYAAGFPAAAHEIVEIDGEAAGQVRWTELPDAILIVDIALLPQYRRRGAARAIYARILERARLSGKPLRATVTRTNAASLAFHQRLGFVVERENESDYSLVAR